MEVSGGEHFDSGVWRGVSLPLTDLKNFKKRVGGCTCFFGNCDGWLFGVEEAGRVFWVAVLSAQGWGVRAEWEGWAGCLGG
jgi:hypothetical protein